MQSSELHGSSYQELVLNFKEELLWHIHNASMALDSQLSCEVLSDSWTRLQTEFCCNGLYVGLTKCRNFLKSISFQKQPPSSWIMHNDRGIEYIIVWIFGWCHGP